VSYAKSIQANETVAPVQAKQQGGNRGFVDNRASTAQLSALQAIAHDGAPGGKMVQRKPIQLAPEDEELTQKKAKDAAVQLAAMDEEEHH
jgi:hypothetical protein